MHADVLHGQVEGEAGLHCLCFQEHADRDEDLQLILAAVDLVHFDVAQEVCDFLFRLFVVELAGIWQEYIFERREALDSHELVGLFVLQS